MKSFESAQAKKMLSIIFQWFSDNQRALPWRVNYTPYEVWISEMMLQQTQMERGVQYYLRWMQRFSSIEEVANAPESDILQAWEGLGYYSRARNLHATAKIICEKYSGKIPCDADLLLALPGIGDYTVAAIMGIAFEKDFPTVDANVERVFSRLCNIDSNKLKQVVTKEVSKIFPKGKARIFNQAWMEFGALICKKVPQCEQCPITEFCESYKLGVQNLRPIPKKKAVIIPVHATFCIINHAEKGYLVRKRPDKGLWANMWEFIGVDSFVLDVEQRENEPHQINKINKSNRLYHDLARSVLIDELQSLFCIGIGNGNKRINNESMNMEIINDKRINNDRINNDKIIHNEIKNSIEKNELHKLNIFPSIACAQVKHSYTNHRLQAFFYKWNIDFDLVLGEDYKWVHDLESVAMPAHHRKAIRLFL